MNGEADAGFAEAEESPGHAGGAGDVAVDGDAAGGGREAAGRVEDRERAEGAKQGADQLRGFLLIAGLRLRRRAELVLSFLRHGGGGEGRERRGERRGDGVGERREEVILIV